MARLCINAPAEGEISAKKLSGYLYRLTEELKYVLSNLGQENLDDDTRSVLLNVRENLSGRVSRADLSTAIRQTERSIETKVEALDGRVSRVEQTADSILSRVEDAEGGMSRVEQTAGGLTARMNALDGRVTRVEAGMDGLSVTSRMENAVSAAALTGSALAFARDGSEKGRLTMDPEGLTLTGRTRLTLSAPAGVTLHGKDVLTPGAPTGAQAAEGDLLTELNPKTYVDAEGQTRFGFIPAEVSQALAQAGISQAAMVKAGEINPLEIIPLLVKGWQTLEERIADIERSNS